MGCSFRCTNPTFLQIFLSLSALTQISVILTEKANAFLNISKEFVAE